MRVNFPYPSASQKLISEIEVQKNELKVFNSEKQCLQLLENISNTGLNSSRLDILIYNLKNNVLFEYPVREKIFNILRYNENYNIRLEEEVVYKFYFYLYDEKIKNNLLIILNRYTNKLVDFDRFLKENIYNFIEVLNLPKDLKQEFPILKHIIKYLNNEKIIKQFDSWIFSLIRYINFLELEDKSFEKYLIKKIGNKELDTFLLKVENAKIKAIYKEYKKLRNQNEYLNIILTKENCSDLKIKLIIQKKEMNFLDINSLYKEAYNKNYISKKKYILFVLWKNKLKIFITGLILILIGVGVYLILPKLIKLLIK